MLFNLMWVSPCRTAASPNPHVRMDLKRENTSNQKKKKVCVCVNAIRRNNNGQRKKKEREITYGVRLRKCRVWYGECLRLLTLNLSTSTPQVSRAVSVSSPVNRQSLLLLLLFCLFLRFVSFPTSLCIPRTCWHSCGFNLDV